MATESEKYDVAEFRKCNESYKIVPGKMQPLLAATVVVRAGSGIGSGFIVSQDGLVLTACHVIDGAKQVVVKTLDGREFEARILRKNHKFDVALLSTGMLHNACLPVRLEVPGQGVPIFALGAPRGLEFSVSKGIVSGQAKIDDLQYLQTDASISPGNSGGPLVDDTGHSVAIVTSKMVGMGVEGVAFGIPIKAALNALELSMGENTDFKRLNQSIKSTNVQKQQEQSKGGEDD